MTASLSASITSADFDHVNRDDGLNTSRHTRTLLYPSKDSDEKKMSTSCLIYTSDMR
jgi:hypothetical protein